MEITEVHSSSGNFKVEGIHVPTTLAAGAKLQATVTFAPTTAGWVGGHFMIASASDYQMLSVEGTGVTANGAETAQGDTTDTTASAKLFLDPATLNFGSVAAGSSKSMTFQLHSSNGAVTVSSIAGGSSAFAISGVSLPLKLAAGKNVLVTVKFTPKSSGSQSGNFTVISTATNSPKTEAVSGTGTGTTQAHSVSLSWTGSASSVSGYNVYRSTSSTGTYTKVNSAVVANTSYKDANVSSGTTYFYATTAVNSKGQESTYSNKVQVAVP